jgi:hypothetical protein
VERGGTGVGQCICLLALLIPTPSFAQANDVAEVSPLRLEPTPVQDQPQPGAAPIVAPELARGNDAPVASTPRPPQSAFPSPPQPSAARQEWYGWQTLIVDGLSIAAIGTGVALESTAVGFSGVGGYLLGAPIVHWAHGSVGPGFVSFGMRFAAEALVVVGGAMCLGSVISSRGTGTCALVVVGALIVPASIIVDAAVLATEEPPEDITLVRQLTPWFSAERRAAGVLWQGEF